MNVMECQTLGTIHESVVHDLPNMYRGKNRDLIGHFVFVYKNRSFLFLILVPKLLNISL